MLSYRQNALMVAVGGPHCELHIYGGCPVGGQVGLGKCWQVTVTGQHWQDGCMAGCGLQVCMQSKLG